MEVGVEFFGVAPALPLRLHLRRELRLVHVISAQPRQLLRHFKRKAVCIVQRECELAGDAAFISFKLAVEVIHPAIQHAEETFLLARKPGEDAVAAALQFGIRRAHFIYDKLRRLAQERPAHAQQVRRLHHAADDSPEHISAVKVTRRDVVGEEERSGAHMVGAQPKRVVCKLLNLNALRRCCRRRKLREVIYEICKQVAFIHVGLILQHHREALQASACVNVLLGQRRELARLVTVELHEYEVPYLHHAPFVGHAHEVVRVFARVFLRALHIKEYLSIIAAGAGIASRPQVVLIAKAEDAVGFYARGFLPQPRRFGVVFVRRHVKVLRVKASPLRAGEEFPCELNRAFLEIVAEAEVTQHLKECVVPVGETHAVDVRRANALLT